MAERKFDPDKVYLQGPDGTIWPYEPLLANQDGFKAVVPNKTVASEDDSAEDTGESQNSREVDPMQSSENVGTVAKAEAERLQSEQKTDQKPQMQTPKPQQAQQNTNNNKPQAGNNAR